MKPKIPICSYCGKIYGVYHSCPPFTFSKEENERRLKVDIKYVEEFNEDFDRRMSKML